MAYNRDDEDKKNKGGSSSESGSSSSDQSSGGGSNPPSLRDNSYISVSRSGGIGTSTADAFNAARNTYNSALSSGMSRNQAWVYTTRGGYGGSSGGSSAAPGAGVGTGAGAFGSGYLTRGSTAYNQAQAQNSSEPTNWTQRREQSKAETFGIQGLQGVNNGQPDIRSDNWYSGASPTAVDIAARIYALDPNNKEAFDFMNQKRLTPGDETYSPYIVPTSRAVYALAELGVEQPAGGFTKEYCQQALAAAAQAGLLQFSDTSGNVKSPGKRASKDEKIAYQLAKLLDDMDRTDKAEIEWNSFKEDVMFKAGDTSRNMSDEEIWASIDWSKYPTLRQAEQDRLSQQPSEFTRALGIDFSYFRGMCWAARNNGGTGDSFSDAIFARLGEGNQWQYDEEKARRRDAKSDDFDPYGSGSTMQDAQLYYGTYDFNDDFWTEHQGDAYSSDSTKSNMFTSLYRADQFTKTANEQLEALKSDVDEWLSEPGGHTDEEIKEKLEDIYSDSDYNAIQKLNDSLMTGAENTTGTIGNAESGTIGLYSRKRLEKYMRSKLAENATAPDPHDEVANTSGGLSGAIGGAMDTVGNFFTGLFRGREGERPVNDEEVGVSLDDAIQEGTRQQQSRNTGSSSLPPLSDLVASGVARLTASATRSDSYPQFTPDGQPFIPPERTTAGPSRADFEKAKSNSDVAQQDRQNRRRNFAEGKYSLRGISTDTERQTFATAYPEFDEDVAGIKDGIENGSMSAQDGYNYTIGAADRLAGDFYFHDTEVSNAFRALEDVIAQEEAQLAGLPDVAGATMPTNPATGQPMTEDELVAARMDAFQRGDSEQWEYLSKFGAAVQTEEDKRNLAARTAVEESLNQHKAELEAMRPQYDQSQERLKDVAAKYALADEMAALDGVDTGLGIRATDILDTVAANFDTVKLPDWNAYDVYAAAEKSGEYTQEEIAAQAKKNVTDCEKNIAELDGLLDIIDRFQLNIPDKYLENIKETKRQAEANKKDGEYYLLRTNPDFAEKVAAGDSAEKWAKEKFHTGSSIGYALYAFKHKTADRSLYAQYPLMGEMSPAELDTAQYLLETQGPITADEYYLHLGDSQYGRLNTRYTEDLSSAAAAFGKKNAVGGTLLSVALSPLNSTGSFQIAFDKLTGRKSNPNSILSAGQKATGAMRQTAKNEVVTAFGGPDSIQGKFAGVVYDGTTSAGDSLINGVLGLGPANMAAAAGTASYNETLLNGGSETQATLMGMVSFASEYFTEKIEMTDIMKALSVGTREAAEGTTRGVLKFFKKQLPELGNEIVGEAVGQGFELMGEDAIMGELSTRNKSIDAMTAELMKADPNMPEALARSEATYQADWDFWGEVAKAGAMGGFSAGISTAGGYAIGNMRTTTERFLATHRLQAQYESLGLDKKHARVLARIDLADINSNTSSYGPNRPSNTAQTAQTETTEETATPVEQTAETANEANPQVSADLSTEAARDEQTAMNADAAQQNATETEQSTAEPTLEERTHQFALDLNKPEPEVSAQSRATSEQFSRRMYALESASTGSASQQVVTITGILDQDAVGSDDQTKAQAQAAAQNVVEQLGRKGCDVLQRLILKARTTNTDFGAVMQAVQVAALTDGESHQLLMGLDPRGISDENFNAFMQAANLEAADQAVRDTMHKRTYDVMIANEKARILSERGVKDLQTASERTSQTRRRRQHAQQQHEAKAQEVENVKQTLAQVNAEYDADTSGDMENAVRDAVSDLPGAIEAERQLAQQLANSEAEEAAAVKAERDAAQAVDTEITQQAQQAVEERMRAVQETRERRADIVEAQRRAIMGGKGTMFVDPKTKLEFHYAIVPVNALITSNTDNGGVNPDYPARLQPRDRTRYSSQVDLENMANGGLTPELLGADNRVQHGAPVVGPDFIVESGNQRTMGIRRAMQNGKANGYTEWLRANAESFGFAPDVVTDNSVLVRVRDTDVDRVAFTREANTVDMASMSPSETAAVDAEMLTPERMAMFVPNDNGSVDNADNRDFAKMYLQEIIPEYERGSYKDKDGKNAKKLYERIKSGLFNRAYHDQILTSAVTEDAVDEVKNVMNAMTNVAPKVALVADGVASGNLYDLDVTQNIVDAAKLIRDIRRDGISLDERLGQVGMFDDGIDPATEAIARMFDANKRSGTKITRALNNLLDDITNLGAPDQVRLDGMELTEAPDKATFVQNSLNRTAGVAELESQGAVEGQTSMLEGVTSDVTSTDEAAPTTDTTVPSTEEAAPSTAPTTGATDEVQAYIRSDVDNLPAPVTQNFESLDVAPDVYFRGTEEQIAEAQAKEDQRKQEFRDIINNETFMALEYTLPDGRKQILHRSARDGVGFQLSYIGSDGIPTMHENYIRTGNTSVNEAVHSEEELLNHLVRENLRKPLPMTIQYAPDSDVQAYMAPRRQQTGQTQQQNTAPKRSPHAIAQSMIESLGIGNYLGTKKMVGKSKRGKLVNLPKQVLGYYNSRAKYIAARPNEVGNYFTTMHEIGHAIGDRIGMTGTQQMVMNLDPAFVSAYKNNPQALPGEGFAEFFRQYMESEAQARAFAGDQFVDDFQRALDDAGLTDMVQNAADELRAYVSADIHNKVQAIIRDKSDRPRTPLSKIMSSIAFRVDKSSAAEKVNSAIRAQTGDNVVPLMADIRANALLQNFSGRVASNLLENTLTDANGNIIGDGLGVVLDNAGVKGTEGYALLNEYGLLLHSLDRDAQGKPVFDLEGLPEQERRARIAEIERTHPEIKAGFEAFQQWRTDFMQAWLVDTGLLTQDAFDRMNDMYPNYLPTQRVLTGENVPDGVSKSGFKIHQAKGATMDIINPMDTWCEMVASVVNTVRANQTALAWHNAFQTYEGLGDFGRQITPDTKTVTVDTSGIQHYVQTLLNNANVDPFTTTSILDAIGTEQSQTIMENGTRARNAITVTLEDGSKVYYQINDTDLFRLLSSADSGRGEIVRLASKTLGRMTKGMSALTTGSNPVFAVRNFLRDFQNSVNYGSWAATYLDGFPKWLAAAYQVWTNSGDYQQYQALGGGGWTRVDTGTQESTQELREKLVKDYGTEGVRNKAKKAGSKVWDTLTFARLNEIIEQASRFAEYRYGQNDRSTEEGRTRAFLAAQDVTVDFARQGYGDIVPTLKQIIPFFGASLQGVYRTGRMLTEAERSRLPARFVKTVFNTALASALSAGFILKFGTDDEKEAFENMSDDLKAGHFYLPNIAPHILGKYPLIRVPLAQDPLTYAVHNIVTNAAWNGTTDQDIIDILATANTILDNVNPLGNPVWEAISGVQNNRNWYGSKIVPTRLENLPASAQYTEETADIFVNLGRVLNVSPLNLQYLAEQYTGYIGQMLIPAISKDENTGELGGIKAALNAAQRRLTTDPLISTDATNTFYDGYNLVNSVVQTVNNEQPLNQLRRGLSSAEAKKAYDEAYKLTHKGGKLYDTKKRITDYYNQIDRINANTTMTDSDKYSATTDVRRKMIREVLRANEIVEEYRQKYMTGDDIATRALFEGARVKKPKK